MTKICNARKSLEDLSNYFVELDETEFITKKVFLSATEKTSEYVLLTVNRREMLLNTSSAENRQVIGKSNGQTRLCQARSLALCVRRLGTDWLSL